MPKQRYLAVFGTEWEVVDTQNRCQVVAPAQTRKEAVDFAAELNREENIKLISP